MLGQSLTDFFLRFSHLTYIFSCQKPVYRPYKFESYGSLKLTFQFKTKLYMEQSIQDSFQKI